MWLLSSGSHNNYSSDYEKYLNALVYAQFLADTAEHYGMQLDP